MKIKSIFYSLLKVKFPNKITIFIHSRHTRARIVNSWELTIRPRKTDACVSHGLISLYNKYMVCLYLSLSYSKSERPKLTLLAMLYLNFSVNCSSVRLNDCVYLSNYLYWSSLCNWTARSYTFVEDFQN